MSAQQNKIRLDPGALDFSATGPTGKTGQAHDDYPAPNSQARYDWMRSIVIGLLSNQSGSQQPTQHRIGTLWHKIIDATTDEEEKQYMQIYNGEEFVSLAKHIGIDVDGEIISLQDLMVNMTADIAKISPTVVWAGHFAIDGVNQIPIPSGFHGYASLTNMRPFVYVDGILLDPRITEIPEDVNTYITISGGFYSKRNQTYTVELKRIVGIEQASVPAK